MSVTMFSLLLLVSFIASGISFPSEEFGGAIVTPTNGEQFTFLEDNIFNGLNSPLDFCKNPHTTLCGKDVRHSKPSYLKNSYQQIREHLVNLLSSPVNSEHEVHALSVEKQMFHQCMNSGTKNDTEGIFETMNFVSDLFEQVFGSDQEWQNIDKRLNSQGLGFTFYDIGVERDPENPEKNIITLQPPSYSRIEIIRNLLASAFDSKNYAHISKSFAWRFYYSIDQHSTLKFFDEWLKAFVNSGSQTHTDVKNIKITINDWNDDYNQRSTHRSNSIIDWEKLIGETFARFSIPVNGGEKIFIKNKDYFYNLNYVLGSEAKDVIVGAIKSKVIAENLRYIDWKNANHFENKKRSIFCFEDTKLYGASFRLLRDLKKEDSSNAPNYEILKEMLRNIASVTKTAITESRMLPEEKTFLKSQVQLITSGIINLKPYRSIVNSYYNDYELSPSYFLSIIRYRQMLKEKELSSLRDDVSDLTETEPFSVTDITKPRNRFILNVFANSFILSKQPIPSALHKEVHYGVYGVKIASFLYGLLNENRHDNRVIVQKGRVDWYDHPNYPIAELICFVGDDLKLFDRQLAIETVTQIFGTHIAYKAMLKDYHDSGVVRQQDYNSKSPNSQLYTADQLFFMSYGKYHCDLSKKVLNTVFSNLNEYNVAFDCYSNQTENQLDQCRIKAFNVQNRKHFLYKSF